MRLRAITLLIASLGLVGAANALTFRFLLAINEDGTFDTAYPAGDKDSTPSAPIIAADAISATRIDVSLTTDCVGGTPPYEIAIARGLGPSNLVEIEDDSNLAVGETAYQDTGLAAETTYHYAATCTDSAGSPATSVLSPVVSATTSASSADVTAPTAPGTAVASDITSTAARCTWTASTDAVGVDHYELYYGLGNGSGSVMTQLGLYGSTTGLSILMTGLTPNQEYYCRPVAFDAAGNNIAAVARTFFDTLNDVPDGNIIFRETFESFPLGVAQSVANRWVKSRACVGPLTEAQCIKIADSDPVAPGFGKYFSPRNIVNGTQNFRTELANVGAPYAVEMTSLGGGNYVGETYWYGYIVCLDVNNSDGYGVYIDQWHLDQGVSAPGWSIASSPIDFANASSGFTTIYYQEGSEEPDEAGENGVVDLGFNMIGDCWNVIWQVRQDTRLASEGSTGILRVWIGDSATPRFEWVNKQVSMGPPDGDTYQQYFKFGGYQSAWRDGQGVNGQEWAARYDNYTVMDDTGSWAAMTAALADPD